MWEDFWLYYPYIKKVSRRWIRRFKNKDYELQDLYHEGILIYCKIYTCYQRLPYEKFIKVLTKSCQNHFISLLRKNTIRTEYFGSLDTYSFTREFFRDDRFRIRLEKYSPAVLVGAED